MVGKWLQNICVFLHGLYLVSSEQIQNDLTTTLDFDPCFSNTILDNEWRLVNNTEVGSHCDTALLEGWYKFSIYGQPATIPTVCIKGPACGVRVPLHIKFVTDDPIPGQISEADLCGSFDIAGKWDCCVVRQRIQVKNCGNVYVYRLVPQDRCNVGYCMMGPYFDIESLTAKTGETVAASDPLLHGCHSKHSISTSPDRHSNHPINIRDLTDVSEGPDHPISCEDGYIPCRDNKECFLNTSRCNDDFQCKDHSDEFNCSRTGPCPEGLYKCQDARCIDLRTESCDAAVAIDHVTETRRNAPIEEPITFPLLIPGNDRQRDADIVSHSMQQQATLDSSQPYLYEQHSSHSNVLLSDSSESFSTNLYPLVGMDDNYLTASNGISNIHSDQTHIGIFDTHVIDYPRIVQQSTTLQSVSTFYSQEISDLYAAPSSVSQVSSHHITKDLETYISGSSSQNFVFESLSNIDNHNVGQKYSVNPSINTTPDSKLGTMFTVYDFQTSMVSQDYLTTKRTELLHSENILGSSYYDKQNEILQNYFTSVLQPSSEPYLSTRVSSITSLFHSNIEYKSVVESSSWVISDGYKKLATSTMHAFYYSENYVDTQDYSISIFSPVKTTTKQFYSSKSSSVQITESDRKSTDTVLIRTKPTDKILTTSKVIDVFSSSVTFNVTDTTPDIFLRNIDLFISVIVIGTLFLIILLIAYLCIRQKTLSRSWTCRKEQYFTKYEDKLLMGTKDQEKMCTENHITDEEMTNDENEMTENASLYLSFEAIQTTTLTNLPDNGEGYIIPIGELDDTSKQETSEDTHF